MELATETKCGAIMYDVSRIQKYNFYLIPISSKFSTKSAGITQLLVINLDVIGNSHLFGISRVHRLLLCIWFPSLISFTA